MEGKTITVVPSAKGKGKNYQQINIQQSITLTIGRRNTSPNLPEHAGQQLLYCKCLTSERLDKTSLRSFPQHCDSWGRDRFIGVQQYQEQRKRSYRQRIGQ